MAEHVLKTWPEYFHAIRFGSKTFELRKNDRNFSVGDVLVLHCWDPNDGGFSSQAPIRRVVSYTMSGGQFGLEPGWVCMGLRREFHCDTDPKAQRP